MKNSYAITLLFLPLFLHAMNIEMTPNKILGHSDIKQNFYKHLDHEDQNDFRLVCKDWARKEPGWTFMPDSMEKEYNTLIQNNGRNNKMADKAITLFILTAKSDLNAIKWIAQNKCENKYDLTINTQYITNMCKITPVMLAIHNNNREIAQILIAMDPINKNWKDYYKKIKAPHAIQWCLPNSHDRDFSFILYILATALNDADTLKKLYTQKIPTALGQQTLLTIAMVLSTSDSLDILLDNKIAQKIIREDAEYFFNRAIRAKAQKTVQKLIENKWYNLNKNIDTFDDVETQEFLQYIKAEHSINEEQLEDSIEELEDNIEKFENSEVLQLLRSKVQQASCCAIL